MRLRSRIEALVCGEDRTAEERAHLVELMDLFSRLAPPPDPIGLFPDYARLKERFVETASGGDGEALEEAFLNLYCHVHGHEAPYTADERQRVDQTGGYWCHAGGLSPILKAGQYLSKETVSGDFGAGNGLQVLLMQKLFAHERSVLVEISSKMIEAGRALQAWLGIPDRRIEWIVGDVMDVSPGEMGFIYLYRPVRPEGPGRRFYEQFAAGLAPPPKDVVIFSIADCLAEFLPKRFEQFYTDGHLTCYTSR